MSADKRSVHTDALATLGTIIDESAGRDAIHLAVEPCIAGVKLYPAQDVGIVDGMATTEAKKLVGIVDPFLKSPVQQGEHFWLIVYPRTITSLRHVWEHPDFGAPPAQKDTKAESEAWLRHFCQTNDCPSYETVVGAYIDDCGIDEEYFHFEGRDAHAAIPDEFWNHMEIVTGKKPWCRPQHFTCSC